MYFKIDQVKIYIYFTSTEVLQFPKKINVYDTNYRTNAVAYGKAHFGQGKGNILMDDLVCTGTELELSRCKHNELGINDCGHDEDAGVYCGRMIKANV